MRSVSGRSAALNPRVLLAGAALLLGACGGGSDASPTPIIPTRLAFTTQPDSAIVGDTVALGATATDASGRPGTTGTIVYASTDTAVARVSAAGVIRFVGRGTATVTATVTALPYGMTPVTLNATLTVLAAVARVQALPARVDAAPGEVVPLATLVYDSLGNRIPYPVAYSSDNAAVASVSASSLTAVGAGSAQITVRASFRGRGPTSTTVPVTVAAVAPGAFHIDLVQVGAVNPTYASVFARAAAFWQTVITAALPSADVNVAAGACGDGTPAVTATTTGVTIFFRVDSIDGVGAILGAAGPCVLRQDTGSGLRGLPVVGTMRFDSADFATLVSRGTAYDVIRHEMGHVLGIGTLWNVTGVRTYLNGAGSLDPQYVGPGGESGSATIGFTLPGAGVPVENVGGPGTANAHWRSSVFQSELMTGYLIDAASHPASRLTVLSLSDFGYTVNAAASEPLLPPAALAPAASRAPANVLNDVALPPLYALAANGRVLRLPVTRAARTALR